MLKMEKHAGNINITENRISQFHSEYVIEPLYRGYGHTVGNALRRVLLSSIPGTAIKGMRIDGVLSEFSVIEGIKEAVTEIVLNVKEVVVKADESGEKKMTLSIKGPKVVTAADLIPELGLEIVNPEQVICHVTTDRELDMEFVVDTGEGFVVSDDIDRKGWPVDFLAVDAIYTPIKNVSYSIQDTMVGRMTDFDKLTLVIETNGSIDPKDAISYAVELLTIHLNPFLEIGNKMDHLRTGEEEPTVGEDTKAKDASVLVDEMRIEELDLTVRSFNCLKKAGIETVGQLVKTSLNDLMKIKNLGKKSHDEILDKVRELGFELTQNGSNE